MANLLHLTGQALRSSTGTPFTSAKAYFYETGTTTPKNTYSDAGLTSANTNPVIADGTTGIFPDIYLLAGRYKVVLQQSDGTSIDTWDPYDATQQIITATAAPSPAYPFMVYHNSTDGHRYRRNAANSAWIDEGLVDSLGNMTTVANQLAGTATNEQSNPDTVAALWQRGSDIASASSLSLPATGGGVYNITGTTTINGISTASGGRQIWLRFAGALTLTHNATSFILPGAANITTVAGDCALFVNEAATDATGSNWRCFTYMRSDGSFVTIGTSLVASQADMEAATSTTKIVPPGRQHNHPGHPKAWILFDASSGTPTHTANYNCSTTITDNGVGDFTVTLTTAFSSTAYGVLAWARAVTAGTGMHVTADPTDTKTSSTFRIRVRRADTGALSDSSEVFVAFYGDQ